MHDITDEQLMAFADGEVSIAERARLEDLIARSPDLRRRLAMFQATGKSLGRFFDAVGQAPVPAHLERMVLASPTPTASAQPEPNVVRLDAARTVRRARQMTVTLPQLSWAHAATLLLGIGLGSLAFGLKSTPLGPSGTNDGLLSGSTGDLRAGGALAKALDTTPSARVERVALKDGQSVDMRIRFSFQSADGYCRHYEFAGIGPGSAGGSGVACRAAGDQWRLIVHSSARPKIDASGAARPAGAEPPAAIAAALGQLMTGDALGIDDEAAAIKTFWRR